MKIVRHTICILIALFLIFIEVAPVPAADLSNWHLRNMGLNAAASGGGIYVAVGDNGFIMRSTDGNNWSAVASNTSDDLGDVVFGNGVFVAVGGPTVLVSADGLSWNEYTPAGFSCYSIAFGNGIFVALDGPDTAFTSPDGISWTEYTLPSTSYLNDITYGGGRFVAVGYSGTVLTSTNGTAWTARTPVTSQTLWEVTYGIGPGIYIAVGASGTVITSPFASIWAVQASGISQTLMTVGYGNNLFVTSGSNSSSDAGHIWTSPDGSTLTEQSSPAYEWYRDVLYEGGIYFLIGGKIITSTNGTAWQVAHGGTGWDVRSIAYGNGVYAAGTYTGEIITSDDGIVWTKPNYPDVDLLAGMAYCPSNQRFVGGINDGSLIYSDDNGATWSPHSFIPVVGLNGLYYVHNLFVGTCASGRLILSSNGTVWSHYSTTSSAGLRGAAYGNNTYVVVGDTGAVVTSQDGGATWQEQITTTTDQLNSVAYGNGTFVAAGGYSGDVITSSDGISWNRQAGILAPQAWYRIIYYDDVFLVMGSYGDVYSSTNGTAWAQVDTPAGNALFCGTADGRGVTLAGQNGTIVQLEPASTIDPLDDGGGGCFIQNAIPISSDVSGSILTRSQIYAH